jgi:hypothetical protein
MLWRWHQAFALFGRAVNVLPMRETQLLSAW